MTLRPRASLGRVLDDLGATLLDLVHGDADSAQQIGGVVIHDAVDRPVLPPHALVLGVGVVDPDDVVALLAELAPHEVCGLVLRAPVRATPELHAAAESAGIAVMALSRGAAWAQLAALLRSLLAEGDVGVSDPETLGGMPSGDLFAVANAIAALLDAPITIEDRSSRVLAFSGGQDDADPSRVETILGRQVPERYARILTDRGVFRDLYRSDRPVHVAPMETSGDAFAVPRVAVAVRAGDEVLGSIWAAVREPLSDERLDALCDAAKLVALHMMRLRAGQDVQRRLSADLLSTALEGGPGAREALDRLGLADRPLMVLGVAGEPAADAVSAADEAHSARDRERLSGAFAMHLSAVNPRSAAALIGEVTYGLVPLPRDAHNGEERATRIASDFLDRVGTRLDAFAAVGEVASDLGGLARSRTSVDRVLRVLRDGRVTQRVSRLADIQVEVLLLELRDLVASRGDQPTEALVRLLTYDRDHNSKLVETLDAWLNAFGDVGAAAATVYTHPNTFRYRLRRVAEVGGIDLTDPETRFSAMLQLRVVVPERG
jgi:DNA-binding PucR family transcriptional regulator